MIHRDIIYGTVMTGEELKSDFKLTTNTPRAITLGSHSGVSVRLAIGQDSCSEEPGRLAAPQLRKWRAGSAARQDHRFVAGYPHREGEFAYPIP